MPLQNRVTPFGDIVALPGRGLLTGNRGILHDDDRRIVRTSQVRRWIACRLDYRGIRRTIMRPHTWTELFFLDEASAFAAGHRPCAECRNADYKQFRSLWEACFGGPAGADAIDAVLHAQRRDGRKKRTYRDDISALPDGAFVVIEGAAWLVRDREILAWSDGGYADRRPRPTRLDVEILTPRSVVAVFAAGYRPGVNEAGPSP
jgi:hypothetical protein